MNARACTVAAVLGDTHFAHEYDPARPACRMPVADALLARAVEHINRSLQPDVTIVLGDLIDDPQQDDALEALRRMRAIIDGLDGPVIALPGNHDPEPDVFYSVFDRPDKWMDIGAVRFMPFVDPEMPEYNALRLPVDLERMASARAGFAGAIATVQHVALFPPEVTDCPYRYVNAAEIVRAMQAHRIGLAISAHYHAGIDLIEQAGLRFVVNPALCEPPFAFLTVAYNGKEIRVRRHTVKLIEE